MPRITYGSWSSPQPDYAIFLLDPYGHVADLERRRPAAQGLCGGRDRRTPLLGLLSARGCRRGPAGAVLESRAPTGRFEDEGWRVRKDGTRFWANVVITALRDERGALVGFGKVTRDLTSRSSPPSSSRRRRRAARRQRRARAVPPAGHERARLRDLHARLAGRIRTWNVGAENIKGYTADEVIGRHFALFYTEEARARRHPPYELEVATREGRFEEEGWRVRKDGTLFWANVVITALRDARGDLVGFAKVTRDLTERRRAQQRLEDSERRAREEAERQRRRSEALERVSRAIIGQLDLDEILQTAIDAATDLTGADVRRVRPRLTATDIVRSDDIGARSAAGTRGRPPGAVGAGAQLSRGADQAGRRRDRGRPGLRAPGRGGVRRRGRGGGVEHRVRGGGRDRERPPAGVRPPRGGRPRGRLCTSATRSPSRSSRACSRPTCRAIPGLELGAHYHAGTELVGGDFYDVFALGEGTWGIVLGDVCGSGPEAASQTALTRHTVRTAAMFDTDPATVLQTLNRALLRSNTDALHHGGVPAPAQACRPGRGRDRHRLGRSSARPHLPPRRYRRGVLRTGPAARRAPISPSTRCGSRDYELRPGRHARALHRRPDRGPQGRRPLRASKASRRR